MNLTQTPLAVCPAKMHRMRFAVATAIILCCLFTVALGELFDARAQRTVAVSAL